MAEPHLNQLCADAAAALSSHGLLVRGGFNPQPGEAGLEGVGTLLLVGNAGPAMWEAFAPHIDGAPDPLNRWTKSVIDPIAARFGARALYPFGEPHWPFQRWAMRADSVFSSPLGILIHPEYGLWHAYRGALAFPDRLAVAAPEPTPDPCAACAEKPCLTACPVGAFSGNGYDVPACAGHLRRMAAENAPGASCHVLGCLARGACPVGKGWRYRAPQIAFHMTAFARAVGGV